MTGWQGGSDILVIQPGTSPQDGTPQRIMISILSLLPTKIQFGRQYKHSRQRVQSTKKVVESDIKKKTNQGQHEQK